MAYNKMLCWVRPREKKELKAAVNNQFPLVFAKSYNDLKCKIECGDYIVISFKRATKKTKELIKLFPNNVFAFYEIKEGYIMTSSQFNISDEPNVIIGQYSAIELTNNYLGVIPDLWKMRIEEGKK